MRRWRAADAEPFARMNGDALVMEHFPAPLSRGESDALIARIERGFERDGFGLWAVEIRGEGTLAGFVGLMRQTDARLPFAPAVEIGWRLAHGCWGRGIATEAARAALEFGFQRAGLEEIVSFTADRNMRSRAVMERLGMRRDPAEDFLHPALPAGHWLERHVLYRISRS